MISSLNFIKNFLSSNDIKATSTFTKNISEVKLFSYSKTPKRIWIKLYFKVNY